MRVKTIQNVSIIGSGLMGCGIAQVFAAHPDFRVKTYDTYVSATDVRNRVRENLQSFVGKGLLTEDKVTALIKRITHCEDLAETVADADMVIECVPEKMDLKQNLFCELESFCRSDAVLATNTSVMSITAIASKTQTRKRIIGTHFWNPPYLIPLVEVIKSDHTDEAVVVLTMDTLKKVGKHPVRVNKDVPGFLANRLQHALWREAFSIVEKGIADAATVDEAIRMGFGLRLPVLGPIENTDMVGTDLVLSIHEYIFPHLENSTEASPLLKAMVANGDLGFKSGKGFHVWDAEKIEASRKKLSEYLLKTIPVPCE